MYLSKITLRSINYNQHEMTLENCRSMAEADICTVHIYDFRKNEFKGLGWNKKSNFQQNSLKNECIF